MNFSTRIAELFATLKTPLTKGDLAVLSPLDGSGIAALKQDSEKEVHSAIERAASAQRHFKLPRPAREELLKSLAAAVAAHKELLGEIIHLDAGKTLLEGQGEAQGSADTLLKTIKDAALAELGGMQRHKERPAVGVVGLITSFNFPLVVANWTIAPALLAGNAVVWKPSEKTPLVAIAYKAIFDSVAGEHKDLLQVVIGGREVGEALVADESIDLVSATGSVAMGKGIKAALAQKKNTAAPAILELGGNNGAIISQTATPELLDFASSAIMTSVLGTGGQRCTNTRRIIAHKSVYDAIAKLFEQKMAAFIGSGVIGSPNDMGYCPLIDEDGFKRFESAKAQAQKEGGTILFGGRVQAEKSPGAYYVEPALALMPKHSDILHRETFAPLLYVVPYESFDEAIELLNAPANAGLVGAIYTLSKSEAERFAHDNLAGHGLINSPKGTGTPAYGMGFGGNKDSGEGEILNAADPLAAFVRHDRFSRIAVNAAIELKD